MEQALSSRIENLLNKLTTQNKIDLVVGGGGYDFAKIAANPYGFPDTPMGEAGVTTGIDEYNIPAIINCDGPAGTRLNPDALGNGEKLYATAFPVGTSIASSWDVEVAQQIGTAIATEAKHYQSDFLNAPGMNIHRNPLCGRNYEYFSEDPVLVGNIAAGYVKGVQSVGIAAAGKHFVANNIETNRMSINENISQRALREIYLRGFEILVEAANPKTIMASYNKVNGSYTSNNYDLLTTILREEWGFQGLVVSDWFAGCSVDDLLHFDAQHNTAAQQIKAGCNLIMPGTQQQKGNISNALQNGTLTIDELNESVRKVLQLVLTSLKAIGYKGDNKPDLNLGNAISRKAASQTIVLLKNDSQTLPFITSTKNIALFGTFSYELLSGGTGSGFTYCSHRVTLQQGLVNAGYTIDATLASLYQNYLQSSSIAPLITQIHNNTISGHAFIPELVVNETDIKQTASTQDVAIITIGRISGEGSDRSVENDFNLTDDEQTLITNVCTAFHAQQKKVIVILNVGGVIETASWKANPDAILLVWFPGQEGGNAIADILSGKENPSAKLPMSFPNAYSDVPSAKTFPGEPADAPTEAYYTEGVYVGYRYYDSFKISTSYAFGFGLSYTKFEYKNLQVFPNLAEVKNITVQLEVTNIGEVAGREVAQIYIAAPRQEIDKPEKELKAFAKTKLLLPGETQLLTFTITPKQLASFYKSTQEWIIEKGTYQVMAAASSQQINLKQTFEIIENLVVEKVNNVLQNSASFTDMVPPK